MRTTLEIPDSLFDRAKRAALERKTTLKALVTSGLEKELGLYPRPPSTRLSSPPITLGKDSPLRRELKPDGDFEAEQDAAEIDEVYRRR